MRLSVAVLFSAVAKGAIAFIPRGYLLPQRKVSASRCGDERRRHVFFLCTKQVAVNNKRRRHIQSTRIPLQSKKRTPQLSWQGLSPSARCTLYRNSSRNTKGSSLKSKPTEHHIFAERLRLFPERSACPFREFETGIPLPGSHVRHRQHQLGCLRR